MAPPVLASRVVQLISVLALSAAVFVAASARAAQPSHARASVTVRRALETSLVLAINDLRRKHGLSLLRPSRSLANAARSHSLEMADDGFFSHTSADGRPFSARIRRFYAVTGSRSWAVGETLLWTSPVIDAEHAVQDWLRSPLHRAVLFDPAWRDIGVSAVHSPDAPGVFGGRPTTIVTADFGARSR